MKEVTNTFLKLEKPMDLAHIEQNTHQPYSPLDSPFKVNQHARIVIYSQKKITNEHRRNLYPREVAICYLPTKYHRFSIPYIP